MYNQQQGAGFGGFGTNNNTGSGFGQTQNTGFGTTPNASGSLFGSTNTGFGTSGSGFGATSSSSTPFGAGKPTFGTGSTSGSGLFGGTPSTSTPAFGGFGGNSTSNTSGGLFGAANKPAFGAAQSSGNLFGGGSVFGPQANQTTSAFGAPLSFALGSNSAECQGTGSTPFSAYTEKEGTGSQMNHFQSISFMQPYKNFSFEELRLADYNQGRRFGNASGQAGAFGANNGFGGIGGFQQQNASGPFGTQQTGGSLFGSQSTSASSPFGGTQTANTGFGGGAFGQKAPTTSLFGNTPASTSQTSGSLFGTSGQSGFGGTQNTSTGFSTSGSLFGSNQQQQQKPGGFGLGTTNTSGPFGGSNPGFGSGGTSNSTGGSLFGQNQTASPFGGVQQQQPATSTPFGGLGTNQQNQNQTATNNPFGGGFGAQQQKSGGIFGTNNSTANNTGGGLFGNTSNNSQQQPATGGLFGTSNQATTNSIFGAPKPATSGTSLFGGAAPTNNNTSNLFGGFGGNNNQPSQNNPATGLFGAANQQQQQKPGGLFGNTGTSTSGGLFGGSNNTTQQQGGGSLFGNLGSNNQPQQSSSLFSNTNNTSTGLFGNSQSQQNALQAPQAMTASLVDRYPYGSASIFDGLPPPPLANPGPLATPINTGNKMKKSAILPQYKINPNAAARLVTPQKRGYGFSYSTYGTPSSVSSNVSTPGGLGGSLLYGSIGRGLGKSLSTSNLRRTFESDRESILSPGAFSAGSSRSGASNSGSLKKLTIDRSLRTDLFGNQGVATLPSPEKNDQSRQPSILKKKVSFDASTVGGNGANQDVEVNGINGSASSNPPDSATPSAQEQGFLRSSSRANGRTNGSRVNGTLSQPEMEQVKGNELAIVHEDGSPEVPAVSIHRSQPQPPQADPAPGAYYMMPSRDQLSKMPNHQLKSIKGFCVGREGCGRVVFEQVVDLTTVNLDNIFGKIAVIEIRSLTVYPETDQKPLLGKGLNVPSTIYLENSWPRQKNRRTPLYEKSGPRFEKHVDRLRKVTGTEFVRYEIDTGTWVFKVPHFTTYALDYDDTGSEGDNLHTSGLSEPPDTPTPKSRTPKNGHTPTPGASALGSSFLSEEQSSIGSSPDDTFDFRKKKVLPGAFDDMAAFEDDQETEEVTYQDQPFLDERLAASPSESGEDEPSEIQMSSNEIEDRSLVVHDEDLEIAGSFPDTSNDDSDLFNVSGNQNPKSILKASDQNFIGVGTPRKLRFHGSEEWADELQRTISPRKQDRQALRENQAYVMKDRELINEDTPKAKPATDGTGQVLATSIDLMNSLFGEDQARRSNRGVKQGKKGKGFEWPYAKTSNMNDEGDMSGTEREFHESYKPSWGPEATLLYAMPSKIKLSQRKSTPTNAIINDLKGTFVSEARDIRFAKLAATPELIPETLSKQRSATKVVLDCGVPVAQVERVPSKEIASIVHQKSEHEKNVWELASILFDAPDPESKESDPGRLDFYTRFRKERFSSFWGKLCQDSAKKAVAAAPNAEERAVAYLSANKIVEACDVLAQGKDFRLAILVSQLDGNDQITREDMATQIQAWRDLNVLSEVTEPIRTLYGLLAGNTCICEGKKGALEDRARTFTISDRFNLDWKRAFGLRFWYAILYEEPIEAAVKKYSEDLANDENKKPVPWFVEEGTDHPWEDPASPHREDLLWGLLKLYASFKDAVPAVSIADLVLPHNTTGNPLDARLSFQLYHALAVRFPDSADAEKADHLAWDFAAQLEAAGEWVWAIFSVLHLSDHGKRQRAIQTLLAQHAAEISVALGSPGFKTLTEEFKIPASWIYGAKALHARAVSQDHAQEVHYLLLAGNWEEAHNTLVRIVAPQCVIEQDYSTLQTLLQGFEKGKAHVTGWEMGGEVYTDYLSLTKGIEGPDKDAGLKRLVRALPTIGRGENAMMGEEGFRETVAVKEMSGVVAEMVGGGDVRGIEPAKVLQLPLTSDGYLKHSAALSLEYYRSVMGA